jgi:hypothetical protein
MLPSVSPLRLSGVGGGGDGDGGGGGGGNGDGGGGGRAAMRIGARRPFPPTAAVESPWRYRAQAGEPEFSMAKAMVALSLVGGMAGYFASKMVRLRRAAARVTACALAPCSKRSTC